MNNNSVAQEIVDEIANDIATLGNKLGEAWRDTDAFSRDEIKLAWMQFVTDILNAERA